LRKVGLMYSFYLPVLGGIEKNLFEIAEELTAKGNAVVIITKAVDPTAIPFIGIDQYLASEGLPAEDDHSEGKVIRYNVPKILRASLMEPLGLQHPFQMVISSLYLSRLLLKYVKKYELDVLYAADIPSMIALFALVREGLQQRLRKVAGIRSSFYPMSGIRYALAKSLFSQFDSVIVSNINTFTYDMVSRVATGKTAFIPNWVDTTRFRPRNKAWARAKLHLNEQGPIILSTGRLIEEKGFGDVIKAFEKVRNELGRESILIIVGSGPFKNKLTAYISQHRLEGCVKVLRPFAFFDPMYPLLYNAADLFVFTPHLSRSLADPLLTDGLSNVVVEALASGVPTIYSGVRGIPEVIKTCLHLVDPSNHAELEETMLDLLRAPLERETVRTVTLVRDYFSKEILLPRFIDALLM
jgi:glycosyltransferase involved in cell wall biosynthesis